MKKLLLVNPPFCTPASPSYALSCIYNMLKTECDDVVVEALDLNLVFHQKKYPVHYNYFKKCFTNYDPKNYEVQTKRFIEETKKDYSTNNKRIMNGLDPELFKELIGTIIEKKPDFVAFSIVYSSQVFYTHAFLKELKKQGIKTIIGGPAVNSVLIKEADNTLNSIIDLISLLGHDVSSLKAYYPPDFNIWQINDYFVQEPVFPLKTSTTCYYKQCSYCSHFTNENYAEYSLKDIESAVKKISDDSLVFLIDDMIKKERLIELSKIFSKHKITWACQLRPTAEYDKNTLQLLSDAGLKMIMWGVESGSERILKKIKKGTNKKDISLVLKNSQEAGIRNICYIMFGFPSETNKDFLDTIEFLKQNQKNIHLISTSTFGLQKDTKIYLNPSDFGITQIFEEKRTLLDDKITFTTESGLTNDESAFLKEKNKRLLNSFNKYPKGMNFLREHMLCLIKKEEN